jgi:hypothetical protein
VGVTYAPQIGSPLVIGRHRQVGFREVLGYLFLPGTLSHSTTRQNQQEPRVSEIPARQNQKQTLPLVYANDADLKKLLAASGGIGME